MPETVKERKDSGFSPVFVLFFHQVSKISPDWQKVHDLKYWQRLIS